jgi:hypothetical protein
MKKFELFSLSFQKKRNENQKSGNENFFCQLRCLDKILRSCRQVFFVEPV